MFFCDDLDRMSQHVNMFEVRRNAKTLAFAPKVVKLFFPFKHPGLSTPRFLIHGFGIFWDFGVFSVFLDPGTNILGNRGLNRKLQVDTYILGVVSAENPPGSDSKIGLSLENSNI